MKRPVYINYVYVTTYLLVYQSISKGGRKKRGPGLPPYTCYVMLSYVMFCLVTNVLSLHGREGGEGRRFNTRTSQVRGAYHGAQFPWLLEEEQRFVGFLLFLYNKKKQRENKEGGSKGAK